MMRYQSLDGIESSKFGSRRLILNSDATGPFLNTAYKGKKAVESKFVRDLFWDQQSSEDQPSPPRDQDAHKTSNQ